METYTQDELRRLPRIKIKTDPNGTNLLEINGRTVYGVSKWELRGEHGQPSELTLHVVGFVDIEGIASVGHTDDRQQT